ncbi:MULTISPECIES: threonine synthase [unclassified Thalassospira]|uniref:threonine synthase n=1 Tax=unclassified Thalassospira TaxID=2648997 RepID=UPI0007A5BA50|nr:MULTISPECIES: threonine synthase [unclassified Thalassospira]KZC98955.1 threonine synthase [Thalassospira sp. MCCC 1A02898]ONH88751.1 threonine synthase [Thalassospira sp. MCCC 1A02803]
MRYVSTRGSAPVLQFDEVLLAGLARDGGLYVPETWPTFSKDDIRALRTLTYAEVAFKVIQPFVAGTVDDDALKTILEDTYRGFDHEAVAPLKQLGPNDWVMELFHGPTLAFKDYALQVVGRLFDHVLAKRGERITIVGATSGDTGSAAIEACRDRENIDIFILHPKGRVSEVQRRQMTTILSDNVHNIAVEGSFDDCQDLVKALFNDHGFRDEVGLSAVNSINWARIMCQIAYYFWAGVQLGSPEREISFSVPSGNFGNVYAGYAAMQMGLPIKQFVVGANRNDILARFFETGTMKMEGVEPSLSPSMDIQVSSNFERLMFDLYDRDGLAIAEMLTKFRETGVMEMSQGQFGRAREHFDGYRLDDEETKAAIKDVLATSGELVDPHSVIGIVSGRQCNRDKSVPMVALATAHPAKFPDAVKQASGIYPDLPPRLSDLYDRPEKVEPMSNDVAALMAHVRKNRRAA